MCGFQREQVLAAGGVARGVEPATDEGAELALLTLVRAVRVGGVHVGGHLVHLLTVSCSGDTETASDDLFVRDIASDGWRLQQQRMQFDFGVDRTNTDSCSYRLYRAPWTRLTTDRMTTDY